MWIVVVDGDDECVMLGCLMLMIVVLMCGVDGYVVVVMWFIVLCDVLLFGWCMLMLVVVGLIVLLLLVLMVFRWMIVWLVLWFFYCVEYYM